MYPRPKAGETEEDLLRLQEEFFQKKATNAIKPAATFVSEKKEPEKDITDNTVEIDIQEQLANTFEAVPSNINLGNVVEKQTDIKNVSLFKFNNNRGFPQAKRRDPGVSSKKGSIFSQHTKKLKKDVSPMEVEESMPEKSEERPTDNKEIIKLPEKSYILQGNNSNQIHDENVRLLKSMSEAEIIEERNKLIETIDPAILAYLKSKRTKEKTENRHLTIKEQNEAAEIVNIEEIQAPTDLLNQPKSEKWLNFDIVETSKLAWMKNIDVPKIEKDKQFEARFDFEGWLLPYSEPEINEENRILYHHGDEPGRPGYTLQELFQLARSSVIQQKIIALNSIANILSLQSTGVYNGVIEIPIEQIFFVLRICLDENTPSVLNGCIKALRNLIYFQIDDTCLDGLLGFGVGQVQPILAIDNDSEDDNTINDQQLAETNLIKCFARTDMLIRIRYIINTVKPALETVLYCLETLTRLARDSQFIINKMMSTEELIESIVSNFIPKVYSTNPSDSSYHTPLLQAIKLLRVLSSRSKEYAEQFINKYKVMESIIIYLCSETYLTNANGLRLQTECMHFWSLLVNYGLALDYFSVMEPVLLKLLDYHVRNTNLDNNVTFVRNGHVAALMILLGNVAQVKFVFVQPFLALILDNCLPKWGAQFAQLPEFTCGKLQIFSSTLNCVTSIRKSRPGLNPYYKKADEVVLNMIKSNGFSVVTEYIENGSMLLNNFETFKSSSNLKTIEGAAWDNAEHVVPIMQTKSCIPFIYNVSQYLETTTNNEIKIAFLQHRNVEKYLTSLKKSEQYYLAGNWFTRTESFLLMNILKISVDIQTNVDTSTFYELAVKCLCIFNSEQKDDIEFVLKNIIFCPKFYPSEILIKHLDISLRSNALAISLHNLDEIFQVYTQVLGLKINVPNFSTTFCVDISIGNVIPIDWIYTPIIVLYSNQQENKQAVREEEQIYVIKNCLRWVLIYETYFPSLAASINATDRFCRLACVFLGSDSLFLNLEIHPLLELCFKNVTKCERDLNFHKDIQGLSNFQDFYTQLLEQYQGVSYGDILFGNVILIPLAQKHLKQYKKTLWSEYMGAVQIFNVTPDNLISSMEMYLEPAEEDMSLLKSYQSALMSNSVRKNTVLYNLASHHVKQFINRIKK